MIYVVLPYLAVISVVAAAVTVADKIAAKRGRSRAPERTLLLIGWAGGAAVMFLTMLLIRHKTRKAKFMLLLPAAIVIHIILLILLFRFFA